MRFLGLPSSIEHQATKRLIRNEIVGRMLLGGAGDEAWFGGIVVIAINQDGCLAPKADPEMLGMASHMRRLFRWWGQSLLGHNVEVRFQSVSMCDGSAANLNTLRTADVVYCCGGFAEGLANYIRRCNADCLDTLRERVQYDALAYIGICAGAMLGSDDYFGLLPMSQVAYDANVSPGQVRYRTNQISSSGHVLLQMTTGCGFALDAWHDRPVQIESFPVIKNSSGWFPFAAQNTVLLRTAWETLANTFVPYVFYDNFNWCFAVIGVVTVDGRRLKIQKSGASFEAVV